VKKTRRFLIPAIVAVLASQMICGVSYSFVSAAPEDGVSAETNETGDYTPVVMVGYDTPDKKLATMRKAADNGKLTLYVDDRTAEIAVRNPATGQTAFSNPYNAENIPSLTQDNKDQLYSQVIIDFYSRTLAAGTANSYRHAVAETSRQLWVSDAKEGDGVDVVMKIGRVQQNKVLPAVLPIERMNEIIAALEKNPDADGVRAKRRLGLLYTLYVKEDMSEQTYETALVKYPALKNHNLYGLRNISGKEQGELEEYFKQAGYTIEQMTKDYEYLGHEVAEASFPLFDLTIQYRLDGDTFTANVPSGSIEYDAQNYILNRISILPYFGARLNAENGTIFIPDGSGALIDFNEKTARRQTTIQGKVYGEDLSMASSIFFGKREKYAMPVFGVAAGRTAVFSVIEDGDALSEIIASASTVVNPFNTAYARFARQVVDRFTESDTEAAVIRYDTGFYSGSFKIRYFLLNGDDANYSGMANAYRTYLVEKGDLKKGDFKVPPMQLDLLGSVGVEDKFLVFNVTRNIALTTFKQAESMMAQLTSGGVENLLVRYQGWANGGLDHTVFSKAKVQSELGGKKGLSKLNRFAQDSGVRFFPDADLMLFPKNKAFSGFSPSKNGAFQLDNRMAGLTPIHMVTNFQDRNQFKYAISPTQFTQYIGAFIKSYDKLKLGSLSAGSLGQTLYSDFKSARRSSTADSKQYVQDALETLNGKYRLMFNHGNAYCYPYADFIAGVPDGSSEYKMESRSVPFMQMVLHAYLEFSPPPINLESDLQVSFLKAVETGSGLSYVFGKDNLSKLKNTDYSEYCSVGFDNWKETCLSQYARLQQAMAGLNGQAIIGHREIASRVFETTYENGARIMVNYNTEDVQVDGETVGALDYTVRKPL